MDSNSNGVVDVSEFLAETFTVTDGAVTSIAGVRNINMPGDEDGAADGQMSIHLTPALGSELGRLAGAQIVRVSTPTAAFTAFTRPLTLTQPSYAQSITGTLTDGSNPVPDASVILFDTGSDGDVTNGVITNAAGQFTINAPVGSYQVLAFKSGYVTSFNTASTVALSAGATPTQNILVAAATTSISGKVADSITNAGLGGVQVFVQSQTGLVAIVSTNPNGTYWAPVTADLWTTLNVSDISLSRIGYLGLNEGNLSVSADTTAAPATGVNVNVPKAAALIRGTVTDGNGIPLTGFRLSANDSANTYINSANTDASGYYVLGVTSGAWNVQISDNTPGLASYVTPNNQSVTVATAQAVQQDFVLIAATTQINGHVRNSDSQPISGSSASANFTLAPSSSAADDWRLLYFGSTANSGDGADLNDCDKDGIVNIVEFAFGLNPTLANSMQLPQAQALGSNFG